MNDPTASAAPDDVALAWSFIQRDSTARSKAIAEMGEVRWINLVQAFNISKRSCTTASIWRIHRVLENICFVRVLNSTPEPDGTRKAYWLRIPYYYSHPIDAVAYTFGFAPHAYMPSQET